jgi:hypothetical protein
MTHREASLRLAEVAYACEKNPHNPNLSPSYLADLARDLPDFPLRRMVRNALGAVARPYPSGIDVQTLRVGAGLLSHA